MVKLYIVLAVFVGVNGMLTFVDPKLKVVVGLVVGGLVSKEYVTLIVEPALTADNKLIEIVLLAGVAVHVVATDWCKHVPPPVRPTVDGTVTTTFELEGSALGTCMMKE